MNSTKTLIYDGSFNGFLTAIFVAFEEKAVVSDIQKHSVCQNGLFSETETIFTQMDKAKRVWNGIHKKSHSAIKDIYFAFLSEHKGIEMLLYRFIRKMFASNTSIASDYSDGLVLKISQLARSVGREKHRMEAFVRFQLTKDEIYFANIEPDFNVLPLISKHFRSRYADQQWLIYDVKRKYGIFYDLNQVEIVSLDLEDIHTNSINKRAHFTDGEYNYQDLWNNYFKSTNIKSRINLKLHKQHVPKRYWKYLSEKKAV
ncbi:TIGR03915 family putative DNA repair protein [Zobellia galactanivorans]|uniref:TIGR03915 family putative DNA repair protein n=1 Tax=Zobellia galactanivorans (strain DSM 12802 / CCUG 47099 / CIP 106680 / NCIMB 13871 / Dsij) TaxID=63186 RepID=UPI001C07D623|nr:TIGR03915 family putative DNA repair protein [Zobellia galactanivorans]MBU3025798.1 TIGR03915 family putative DNA repair protein [Zobellia galactanivorans]MDO6808966.1 TIGR03915 family putative DNA repair protein [Zobellia galactanivorans]